MPPGSAKQAVPVVPKVPQVVEVDIVWDKTLGTAEIAPDKALEVEVEVEVVVLNSGPEHHLRALTVGEPGTRRDNGMRNPDRSHARIAMLPAG